jgi:UPF0755 protein
LLPDTYKITRGDQRSKILAWMADAERTALNDIWKRRSADLPIHSAQELVVLASIVEKEASKADERPRVAGVLLNRLQKNMRLQSDPTIVYGLTGGKGPLGHGLTKDEIAKPTPYNTYTVDGLPPGPIANPGRAALEAVANPSRTKELYFVADGTGGHVFAETLDQHLHNVVRWRQIEADRAAASAAAAAGNLPGTAPQTAQPSTSVPSFAAPVSPGVGFPASTASPPAAPVKGQKRGANTPASNGRPVSQTANALAKPDDSAILGNLASMPLTAAMRAKLEQDAATAGVKLRPSFDQDQSAAIDPNTGADASGAASVASDPGSAASAIAPRRPIAFDAVAGTKKDPLNNKTFDLNSPKTVPNLK